MRSLANLVAELPSFLTNNSSVQFAYYIRSGKSSHFCNVVGAKTFSLAQWQKRVRKLTINGKQVTLSNIEVFITSKTISLILPVFDDGKQFKLTAYRSSINWDKEPIVTTPKKRGRPKTKK